MFQSKINYRSIRRSLLLGAASVIAFAVPAIAADNQVETVIVTGSMIPRTGLETPSPVTVVSALDIQNMGLTSTADVVRTLSADSSGTIPTAFGEGFASGSSGVALRGLTVNSTLVLINGRRTANYPLADDGERGFVDLNTIPLDVVDRVEVLKDGASSLYGADAIAGVVNIILKQDFQGTEGQLEWGTSEHGGGTKKRLTATVGYGDMATDHFNAYVNVEYEKDDAIYARQRSFPLNTNDLTSIGLNDINSFASIYGRVAPTVLTDPSDPTSSTGQNGDYQILAAGGCGPLGTPGYDPDASGDDGVQGNFCEQNFLKDYGTLQPSQERYGVYSHMTIEFSPQATAYIDGSYFENKVSTPQGPVGIQTTVPMNTSNIALPAYLTNGMANPNDPFVYGNGSCSQTGTEGVDNSMTCPDALIAYNFGDIPGAFIEDNHVLRATAGLKGNWKGWTYDMAFVAAHAWLNTINRGFLNGQQLIADVLDGSYNFVDPSSNSAAVRAALAPDLTKISTTDELEWSMNAVHDVFALPGGEAQFAFGLEARHEATYDPDLNPGLSAQGLGIAHTIGQRNIYSAFAELDMPVFDTLDADLSGRVDHYSDFGSTFNPKVGLKWTPLTEIAFRGTYSTGFRAPSFSENGSSASEGFVTITPSDYADCAWLAAHGATACDPSTGDAYTKAYSVGLLSTANPSIRPEKAANYTVGTILQPFDGIDLTGTVDYYHIKKTNVISPPNPGAGLAPGFGVGSLPAGYTITYDAPDPLHPLAPLRPSVVAAPYINASSEVTSGIDVNVHFGTDIADGLHWASNVEFTQIFSFRFKPTAGGPTLSYVGTTSPFELSSEGGTPRNRGTWTNTITWDALTVSGTLNYVDGMRENAADLGISGCLLLFYANQPQKFCQIKKFYDFDLTGRYAINDNMEIYGSVMNLFDTKPPLDLNSYAGSTFAPNYDPAYAQTGAVGRFFSIGVSFKD